MVNPNSNKRNASGLPLNLKQLAATLGGDVSGDSVLVPGPGHSAKDRSLSVTLRPTAPDGFLVYSHAGDDPLKCKDYVREKCGIPSFGSNAREVEYVYRDESGKPYVRVKRTADKQFYQSHWNGQSWTNGTRGIPKLPYRLPELLASPDEPVFVVEGEKDADRLADGGLVATTATEGAGKWREELNKWFVKRTVYVLADNDEPGLYHARSVRDRWITLEHSKIGEPRGIPLHEFLVPLFTPLVERGGVMFLSRLGKPYPIDDGESGQMKTSIIGARKRSGLKNIAPYTARHTVSTQLVINRVHPHTKDQILGHAVDDMSRHYTHVPQAPMLEAINTLSVIEAWGQAPWMTDPVGQLTKFVAGTGKRNDLKRVVA